MNANLESLLVSPSISVREAIGYLNRNGKGIVLVVDDMGRLQSTVTDGDLRRAVLAGFDLDKPIDLLLGRMRLLSPGGPVTAPAGSGRASLIETMRQHSVRQIPLVDGEGRVAGLVTANDLLSAPPDDMPVSVVVMAGGYGTRLRPLTEHMPKPMLPFRGKPLLEHTIRQLSDAGIHAVNVTTHYKSDVIMEHFGDGSGLGVEINYIKEKHPLGTAGSLALMAPADRPMLVINGDVLTDLNFRAMLAFHKEHGADMTVGLAQYQINVPYGVVSVQDISIQNIEEKPNITLLVNAGVYLLEPVVHQYIPRGRYFDMVELIEVLRSKDHAVIGFPICEYWLDIGRIEDYQKAQRHAEEETSHQ